MNEAAIIKDLLINHIDAEGVIEYLDLISTVTHESNGSEYPEDAEEVYYEWAPLADYPKDIRRVGGQTFGESGPGSIMYILASAPSIVAFAGLIKAFIFRHKYKKVIIYWKNGKKHLEVDGGMSVEEIEQLMRAQIAADPDQHQA